MDKLFEVAWQWRVLTLVFFLLVAFSHLASAACEIKCEAFTQNEGIKSTWIGEDGKPGGFVDVTQYGCRLAWAAPCCTEDELKDKCKSVLRISPPDNELEFTKDYEKEVGNDIWFLMKVGTYRSVWCESPDDFQNPTGGFHITQTFRFKDCNYWLKGAWDTAKKKLEECAASASGCEDKKKAMDDAKSALDKSKTDLATLQAKLAEDQALLDEKLPQKIALDDEYTGKIKNIEKKRSLRDEAQQKLAAANSFKNWCVGGELAVVGLFGFAGHVVEIICHVLGLIAGHIIGCGEADQMIKDAQHELDIKQSDLSGDEMFLKIWENDNLATLLQLKADVISLVNSIAKEETDIEAAQHDVVDNENAYDKAEQAYDLCLEEKCKDLLEAEEAAHAAYQACLDL